jgi:hypothetical protein
LFEFVIEFLQPFPEEEDLVPLAGEECVHPLTRQFGDFFKALPLEFVQNEHLPLVLRQFVQRVGEFAPDDRPGIGLIGRLRRRTRYSA